MLENKFGKLFGKKESPEIDVNFRIEEEIAPYGEMDEVEDARRRVIQCQLWLDDLEENGEENSPLADKIREYMRPYFDLYSKSQSE